MDSFLIKKRFVPKSDANSNKSNFKYVLKTRGKPKNTSQL